MIQRLFFGKGHFRPISDPCSCKGQKPPNAAKRAPNDQQLPLVVRCRHSDVWKPSEPGVCTWERCPRNCDCVRLAEDTALFQFWPMERILGPTDASLRPNGSKHGQKAAQTIPKWTVSINKDNGTHQRPPRGHRSRILVTLGKTMLVATAQNETYFGPQ